jgi:hypothetical protein
MRTATMLAAVLGLLLGMLALPVSVGAQPPAPPTPPGLAGYRDVTAEGYLSNGEAYFQTPDGLLCAIRPVSGTAGCDGRLPATRPGVNEIVLAADDAVRGLRATANPLFVKPSGGAAAIGPATLGLPPGFPDPNDFVVGDDSYVVGSGPKNLFPVFTVEGGLTCSIMMFSGGEFGCDGPLPGVRGGENQIYAQVPGGAGIRRADDRKFSTPAYPGHIRQLPVGYRVREIGATCMAITGGVACYAMQAGHARGFEVTPERAWTFGHDPSPDDPSPDAPSPDDPGPAPPAGPGPVPGR